MSEEHVQPSNETVAADSFCFLVELVQSWSELAWNAKGAGFVESLDKHGRPNLDAPTRIRVQARQVFCCAEILRRKLPCQASYQKMMSAGVEYLEQLGDGDRGWPHLLGPNGSVIDATRDLYDHAFIALAGARVYAVTANDSGRRLAESAVDFIESKLSLPDRVGWIEDTANSVPRRSNPHMHLFEALIELYIATRDDRYAVLMKRIRELCLTRFVDPVDFTLAERFDAGMSRLRGIAGHSFEPGHHYEWATLLKKCDGLMGFDSSRVQLALIRTAETFGLNQKLQIARNECYIHGPDPNPNSRLWPQLERFRAIVAIPSANWSTQLDSVWRTIKLNFLNRSHGCWVDEIDQEGKPISELVPASMMYHFMTAFEEVEA